MIDTSTAATFVQLPLLSVDETITVARQLVEAARKKRLPARLGGAAERLSARLDALESARRKVPAARSTDAARRLELDREADLLLSVLCAVLTAWARLPGARFPQAAQADALLAAMFPNGLRHVIQAVMDVQHTRMDLGLARIKGLAAGAAADTGVAPLLDRVRALMPDYAAAAQPSPATAATATPVRKEYLDLVDAVRVWVLQVAAHVDPDNANTAKRARRLLAPLDRARRPATRRAAKAEAPTQGGGAPLPT